MRRFRLLLIAILCLGTTSAMAQVANYTFSHSAGTYTAITGGTVSGATGDSDFENITLPFSFIYNGISYNTGQVSTNGWFAFGTSQTNSVTGNNLASTSAKPFLAPLWDDLNVITANGGEIRYETSGTSPNQVLTIQWTNTNWNFSSSSGTPQNFQIKLYEASMSIDFIYGSMMAPNNPSASIGINDEVGGSGHFLSVTPAASPTVSSTVANNTIDTIGFLPSGQTYTFSPPAQVNLDLTASGISNPPAMGCYGSTETVEVTVTNLGANINFSSDSAIVGVVITGPNPMNLSTTVNTGTLNTFQGLNVVVASNYDMSAAGTYSFEPYVITAADSNTSNDTGAVATRTTLAGATLPDTVDFVGFTGGNLNTVFPNWSEADGFPNPSGSTSAWTDQSGLGGGGNITARVNLYSDFNTEWIIGPKVNPLAGDVVSYKVAVSNWNSVSSGDQMGSDDMLVVFISTDCGATWTGVDTVDASDNLPLTLTQRTVDLTSYAGQDIIIAFYATDGSVDDSEDYDLHLDDIFIGTPPTVDLSATGLAAPSANGCYSSAETVEVTIFNASTDTLDFANDNATVGAIVTGTNAMTLSTVVSTGTLAPSASMNVSVTTTYDMSAVGTYTFEPFVNTANDGNNTNDTAGTTDRIVTPLATLPSTVDFNGFTGGNLNTVFPDWNEADGLPNPTGTTSAWTDADDLNVTGNKTARINLYSDFNTEWIIGPKFTAAAGDFLQYKVAVSNWNSVTVGDQMGSDDMLRAMISTDCGGTWTAIDTVDASDNLPLTLTQRAVDLSSYAGQDIIIGFVATDGPVDDSEDYDLHIDDIFIGMPPSVDLSATTVVNPPANGCYTSTETVEVTIVNASSTDTLDFTVDTATVGAIVTGPNAMTLTTVVNTGTLAPLASMNVTITTTYDMSAVGTYDFEPYVSVAGDGNLANDTGAIASRTLNAAVALPISEDFTGYTGGNLNTINPDWFEADGLPTPSGTTSSWTDQTGLGGTGNITARINLYSDFNTEWLIGPKFTATGGELLTYDVAVSNWNSISTGDQMGSDDMMRVMLSTDCGGTWTAIDTVDTSDNLGLTLTQRVVDLTSYTGQDLIIAFLATDGPVDDSEDYDLHLDNINIVTLPQTDVGVINIIDPQDLECGDEEHEFTVEIENFGLQSQSNIPISIDVTGSVTTTLTATYAGPLAPGATAVVIVDSLNTTAGGFFNVAAYTTLGGDQEPSNDTMSVDSVEIFGLPVVNLGNDTIFCAGPVLTLDAGNYATFAWSDNSMNQTLDVTTSGTYYVDVADANGCDGTDTIVVTVDTVPALNLGPDVNICGTDSVTLDAGAGLTYMWSDNSSNQTLTVTMAGSYSVEVTDGNGCQNNDTVDVGAFANPVISLGNDTAICAGEFVTLAPGNFASYLWNDNSMQPTLNAFLGTDYSVTVTDSNGCQDSDTISLMVNPLPTANLGPDTSFCDNQTLTLDPGQFSTYQWSDNSNNPTLDVTMAGTYAVTITNSNGCQDDDSVTVMTLPSPQPNLSADTAICEGESLVLDPGTFASYLWSGNETTPTLTVDSTNTYSVTVTEANGCTGTSSIILNVNPLPTVALGNDTAVTNGDPVTLDAGAFAGYLWNDNSTNQTLTATVTGSYSVTVTDANGCEGTDTIEVTIWPVGIDGLEQVAEVVLFPNPTNGLLNLQVTGLEGRDLDVRVVSLQGQLLVNRRFARIAGQFTDQLDLSQLAQGVYLVQMQSGDQVMTQRISVK